MAQKGPNRPKVQVCEISGSGCSKMVEQCSVERGCSKSGHIRANALEPFHGSEVATAPVLESMRAR